MAKAKNPTPAELYAQRKQREEQERRALMPPGLVNAGNTCFMNSVLQGLFATRLLSDLVYFNPIAPDVQAHFTTLLYARRSPLLTNGTKLAGEFKEEWVDTMPIGDIFINTMLRAWDAQRNQRRENQTPRNLLAALGRKYDQYLDFAQQDAHEFMRILLDAMRMEEFDVIKKRQPPQPTKKQRHKTSVEDDEEKLISLSDMLFGGKLTSILVCQKCKHVSQTYEDFNDLSLSIKPEDYARERRRDRLKNLAKRLGGVWPGNSQPQFIMEDVVPPRSSSAPPTTPHESPAHLHDSPLVPQDSNDDRHKSVEILSSPSEKHLEFVEPDKPQEKNGWGKIGRRLSMSLGGKGGRDRRSRSRERRVSRDVSSPPITEGEIVRSETPSIHVSQPPSDDQSAKPIPVSSPPASSRPSSMDRRSPKPPKPSRRENEYLRRVLADTHPASSNPFARMAHHAPSGSSEQSMWWKLSQLPSIEECLKMFTSVEVLDGDNRVGCRRCWKIANGLYTPPKRHDHDSESMGSRSRPSTPVKDEDNEIAVDDTDVESALDFPKSMSTPDLAYGHKGEGHSLVSLPTTIAGDPTPRSRHVSSGNPPIPTISTTAPPSPDDSSPPTTHPGSEDSHGSSKDTLLTAPDPNRNSSDVESDYDSDSSSSEEDVSDDEKPQPGKPHKRRPKPTIQRPAYKRYLIASPPPVLVVHLKRFQQLNKSSVVLSFSSGFKKIDDYVTFPETLDLTPFLAPRKADFVGKKKHGHRHQEKCSYRLYAVVVHSGTMLGGHYITYAALPTSPPGQVNADDGAQTPTVPSPQGETPTGEGGSGDKLKYDLEEQPRQWAYISDTVVRLTTLEEVLKAKAYICMYERV
ncbi:cysteine proteinase [Cylindrobasidium torrendii FP15055 ss-10]|uniref:Ubiquitin carboxyl-terminal hydrolase n=1 Tax=Cylindrobasidium torrendii FP15055 ss-10 TaxID=1314674 RepID=A0A0D7BMF3_9AGAR|nr:cysteine proteinase [Cylindrobasidium torrendii FP15055 ss-10]